ncbi:MAG: hypothetical protein JWO53_587 [Chlamydiia bacterium]|nr:hypothetical protein [Chlamydiia bacterium]
MTTLIKQTTKPITPTSSFSPLLLPEKKKERYQDELTQIVQKILKLSKNSPKELLTESSEKLNIAMKSITPVTSEDTQKYFFACKYLARL